MNDLRELQLKELEILKYVVELCEKNSVLYYISGGTYLGAVRHKGFIPWDDDIDIAMPRNEYERFMKIIEKDQKYKVYTYKNCKESIHYHMKVVDESVKVISHSAKFDEIWSSWVDIFPLDGMPSNFIISKIHQFNLLRLRALFKLSCFNQIVNIKEKNRPLIEKILIKFGLLVNLEKYINTEKQLNKIDKKLKKFNCDDSNCYVNFMGSYKFKSIIDKKIYGKGRLYEFEGLKLNGPEFFDDYLTIIYGDYMKIPSESEMNKHNTEIVK